MKITIFTPTYNRENYLNRLYESIKRQKFDGFEWIIVDDGSIDNTKSLVEKFIKEKVVKIKYVYQKNGGKHRAINNGIRYADGILFFIVDSDDYLTNESLKNIWRVWCSIKDVEKNNFAGVGGLKGYDENNMVGTTFQKKYLDADSIEFRYKFNIKGDKSEVIRTEILKKFLFPEFAGEKFLTEAVMLNAIANVGYKFRWFNKIIYICNYLQGGLTDNSLKNYCENWEGTSRYFSDLMKYEIEDDVKINIILKSYLRIAFAAGKDYNQIVDGLNLLNINNKLSIKIKNKILDNNSYFDFQKRKINSKIIFNKLNEKIEVYNLHNICIYGGGEHTKKLLNELKLKNTNIIGIIDKDSNKWNTSINEYMINSLDYYINSCNGILISSYVYENEIYKNLYDMCKEKCIKLIRIYDDEKTKDYIFGSMYWNIYKHL